VRIRPTEAIHFAALFILTVLTLIFRKELEDPGGMLLAYAGLAAALIPIVYLSRREDRLPRPLTLLIDFYPAAFVPMVFNTLSPLIMATRGGPRDDLLIAADRGIFGVDVTVWMEQFSRPRLNDALYIFYATYYFIALIPGLILWFRDRATARRFVFTLMLVYYVSYAGYFTIPALGPRFAQADLYTKSLTETPVSRFINDTINHLEKTKLDVFPSGHTMISMTVLIVMWKRARDVFWWLLPIASGLILATVYCRFHYVVDLIAGTTLAFVCVPLGDRLYDRLLRPPSPLLREGPGRPYSAFS
jgi:membrane-associated phospholipid phosphatase